MRYAINGARPVEDKLPSKYASSQGSVTQNITFNFDDLPTNGQDEAILRIPANSRVIKSTLRVITAFAGGTSYVIGLNQPDGTVIDADGLHASFVTAAIDAVGETVVGGGALVGNTAGTGTADGQVVVAATGTYTAGRAVLEVEYEELLDRAQS